MSQGFNPPSGGPFGSSPSGQSGFGAGQGGFGAGAGNSGGFGGFGQDSAAPSPFGGAGNSGFSTGGFDSGFGSAPAGSRNRGFTKAPIKKLIPSLVFALLGIGLNIWLIFSDIVATDTAFLIVSGAAWGLAGIFGISMLSWYFNGLNEARANGIFVDESARKAFFYVTAIALLIAVLWSAFNIAQFFGKL
ncbi:hypothetical protein SFC07_09455 [Corynebacterium callunae]|uniref:hypothetical protein n=1 Tax=Corynebacterium callunae TaxID=1721 RepID=UPI0039820BC7